MRSFSKVQKMINRLLIGTIFLILGIWIYLKSSTMVEAMPLEQALVYLTKEPLRVVVSFLGSIFGILLAALGSYIYFLPLVRKGFF